MDNNITIVTAFFDICRDLFKDFRREVTYYTNSFIHYLDYPYVMVCYIDDRYIEPILEKYEKSKYKNKRFIPINKQWLFDNIDAWKRLHIDKAIIDSDYYKELLDLPQSRRRDFQFPENHSAKYNAINHSKIDFINHSIANNYINSAITCWCDFGYFETQQKSIVSTLPKNTLDINKFHEQKISFILKNEINEKDMHMIYTLISPREVFTGTFFGGPTFLMKKLQKLYHNCIQEMYEKNVSDDDQHVFLRCYLSNPDLFDLHVILSEEWPRGLTLFSIDE